MGLHHMGLHIARIHLVWRCFFFSFLSFVFDEMHWHFHSANISPKLPNPSYPPDKQGKRREEKWNRLCLFVVFLQSRRLACVWKEAVSDLSGEKLMSKIALSAPRGYKQTTDNWIRGLSKTQRSNSSCFTGCKHRSSHLSNTFRARRAPCYRL